MLEAPTFSRSDQTWKGASSGGGGRSVGATKVFRGTDRRLLNRFTGGMNGPLINEVTDSGGVRAWFERQLKPSQIADGQAAGMFDWYPRLHPSPAGQWRGFQNGNYTAWELCEDLARWTIMRRIYSRRQVHEVMTDFWSNLLHVPSPLDKVWPVRTSYDATIRQHALGRYDDLLVAAVLHPAMLCYLDNYVSTAQQLNENLGREVLECHTVGEHGGYDEDGVRHSARILTGWTADRAGTWERSYVPSTHAVGPVRVMGFSAANGSRDGRQMSEQYLRWLAHHPATARRVARRLAVRFVADSPPTALVNDVAETFHSSGTNIAATLRALVDHPLFTEASQPKVRTPIEDYVATCRALQVKAHRPTRDDDFARLCLWQAAEMGQMPFDWTRPDGFPETGDAWTSTSRMLGSWKNHHSLAFGARPARGATYRDPRSWLPDLPVRFDALVDHACQALLKRPASDKTITAAALAVDAGKHDMVNAQHRLIAMNRVPLLITCLLDSAQNMER